MSRGPSSLVARLRGLDLAKMLRYSAVSAVAFPLTQVLLVIGSVGFGWSGVTTNLVAVSLVSIPAYVLNRYWVWGKKDNNSLTTEILPFWGITLLGLAISTGAAYWADRVFDSPYAVNLANTFGFGVVWVFKYVLLDRMMFGAAAHPGPDADADADAGLAETPARA